MIELSCENLSVWYITVKCSVKIRYRACFEQGVPWHLRNYRVRIHSKTHTWHDKNIESNAPYRQVLTTQLHLLASLTKSLSLRLGTKWFGFESRCSHLEYLSFFYCFLPLIFSISASKINLFFCLLKEVGVPTEAANYTCHKE